MERFATKSLQLSLQLFDQLSKVCIVGINFERSAKFFQGFLDHSFSQINPPQIDVRKVTRLIALGGLSALQPRNRVVEPLLLHEIDANVVIRVAELGVQTNGNFA